MNRVFMLLPPLASRFHRKRQRTAALQDASRDTGRTNFRRFWSAAVLCRFFAFAILAVCNSKAVAAVDTSKLPPPANVKVDFARDIQPIFERSCLRCHGPEKPKSGFRLDNREAALKGGENGKAMVPGDSTNSPLIHLVAGLDEEIGRMPPKGKGDPLTAEEISLLRAWIDQGAQWPEGGTIGAPKVWPKAAASPGFRWISVSGDKQKFREHFWMKDGLNAGLESFSIQDRLSPDSDIRLEGRYFPEDEDIRLALRVQRRDVGFIDVGFDQFRSYYDNSGGFYPSFAQPLFDLDRELSLRSGKAWADFGLTLPDWPKVTIGYEYRFREGTESTLQWGSVKTTSLPVLPETSVEKKIYPAFKDVDERVHILKLDATHEMDGLFLEDNFRAEFSDLKTHRENVLSFTQGQTTPSKTELLDEGYKEFRAVNSLRVEKEVYDWWFVSAGYLYSKADADAEFRQNTVSPTGLPVSGDFWHSHSIILSQDSVLLNANTRLGPWENFTFSAGVQSEWVHQQGLGRVSLDSGNPAVFLLVQPATLDANLDRQTLQESASLRYTGLPFTSLFAEGKLAQEKAGTFEDQIGGDHAFTRDTDAQSNLKDWRVGFYSSPLNAVSISGHYRRRDKDTDYDQNIDTSAAYPAFFREREIKTDEIEAKLTWRPLSWLKTTLSYQIVDTDFDSDTDPITGVTPGGRLHAGTFNANVYGANLMLSPFSRWYFSGALNYYESRSKAAHNNLPSIEAYRGDIYSVLGSATYMLSTNTDLTATYTFSKADYGQHNFGAGLPLGTSYDWHVLQAGVARRFKRATANLQYAFYQYSEPTSSGFNDYTAHAVFATLTLHWP